MTHIDRWIVNQLSLFSSEMRSNLPAAFIFEGKFSSSPGALFDILTHKCDTTGTPSQKLSIQRSTKNFGLYVKNFEELRSLTSSKDSLQTTLAPVLTLWTPKVTPNSHLYFWLTSHSCEFLRIQYLHRSVYFLNQTRGQKFRCAMELP